MIARAQTKERTCIATRQSRSADEMLRFVQGPDNALVFDIKGRLPGRGVWITADRAHLERAIKKGAFHRALKAKVDIAEDLLLTTEQQLRSAALGSFGLGRKAGQIITGFASVEAALKKGGLAALIHASDGAEDGRRKLTNVVRNIDPELRPADTVIIFTANELSLALGRSNVIHAAATMGHAGEMFVKKARMVTDFCTDDADGLPERRTKTEEPLSHETTL